MEQGFEPTAKHWKKNLTILSHCKWVGMQKSKRNLLLVFERDFGNFFSSLAVDFVVPA